MMVGVLEEQRGPGCWPLSSGQRGSGELEGTVPLEGGNQWETVKVRMLVGQSIWSFATPWTASPPGSSDHGTLQARILEWVGCHFLLQGIFPIQGFNSGLPHCRKIFYQLVGQRFCQNLS